MRVILIVASLILFTQVIAKEHPEAKLDFMDYCRYFHYPVEYHDVTTEDGYILRVFRIQKKGTQIKGGLKPILLQHGLLDSSDTWIINELDKAPAFVLADAGFDVWMGNNRGNKHSRKHVKLNPDKDPQYWSFTFQHMAEQDLPSMFKFISSFTLQKVSYIGHSQGTMQMHIALAERNLDVEQNLDKYFAFGPVAYVCYQQATVISMLVKSPVLEWYHIRHVNEFMPSSGWFESAIGRLFCADFPKMCGDIMKVFMGANPQLDNYERYDVMVGHNPSGTSIMNMAHWKQIFLSRMFQAYDYGSSKANTEKYGQPYPPLWDLGKVRQPIRLFTGSEDEFADIDDVNYMWSLLDPSVKEFLKIYKADHVTFMWGQETLPWMTDLLAMINKSFGIRTE